MPMIPRLFLLLVLAAPAAQAQDVYVPEPLREWQEWVLEGKEYRDCPFFFDRGATRRDEFVCAWPGLLELDLDADGGRFTVRWTVYAEDQWLALPGNAEHWPQGVAADGRTVSVVARREVPSVRLGPGNHVLSGSFEWDEMPAVLSVPDPVGLIALRVDGAAVDRPERSRGSVFLYEREPAGQTADSLSADVFRLVRDDVPTRLVTKLRLNVAGSVREEVLGPILPEGFVPLTLDSALPARLEADGNLRIQVRPGAWVIDVAARAPGVIESLELPGTAPSETWSYAANDAVRIAVVEGVAPIDPQQADVPREWRQLPAYRVATGDAFRLVERSRGIVAADNDLTLSRRIWLDFDGSGFVVSDRVGGSMRTGWRLDMSNPYGLLNATVDGADLLITDGPEAGQTGVEIRRSSVSLETLGRIDARGEIPVTGWATRFSGVSAVLEVPPGRLLFAAPGVDQSSGSWVGQWQLLDFFLVLVITIGTWRLFGAIPGVIAFFAVTLGFHEANAPAWLWLNVLVAIALCRVAPAGRLLQSAHVYRAGSALALLIVLITFVVGQISFALYPQLERPFGPAQVERDAALYAPTAAPVASMVRESQLKAVTADEVPMFEPAEEIVVTAQEAPRVDEYMRYAPDALVQAGAGKPDWSWKRYRLGWGGPVTEDQAMRLMILPSWAVTWLRLADVLLVLAFAAILAGEILGRGLRLPGGSSTGSAAAVVLLTGCLALLVVPVADVRAQTPDPALLEELERRLLAPPECAPRCAELVAAEIRVTVDEVRMQLSAHAFDGIAVPLPGTADGWRPTIIRIGGAGASQVLRGPGELLYVRLPEGRHTIDISGPLPAGDSVEIPFLTPPRAVTVTADGWLVEGVRDRRLLTGSLQLTRLRSEDGEETQVAWEASRFPPFAEITRSVKLDLDWTLITRVRRLAPAAGAITLDVPLLDGEAVITEGVDVSDGRVLVTMAPDQRVATWASTLPRAPQLELTAAPGNAWQDVWRIGVGRAWRAQFAGVPESAQDTGGRESRVASFHPRGGESLAIDITRPAASAGATLAFDRAELSVDVGSRSRSVTLSTVYRSTRGDQHVLRLPPDAEVTEVRIDGRIEPLRAEAGELAVPILPGQHSLAVSWRSAGEIGFATRTPAVDLGAAASNLNLGIDLPRNRWLLGTGGPPLGPAVLYWPQLAALVLFALILGRTTLAPLGTWQWLLLGLGFSTFNWPVLGWIVAWLLVCGVRARVREDLPWWQFNALQVVVAVFTVTSLLAIIGTLPEGLLGVPDMHVTGNSSYGNTLRWFADSSNGPLPGASAWTVPLWSYKALILGWALWLSFALLRWLPWIWTGFSSHGFWRSRPARG